MCLRSLFFKKPKIIVIVGQTATGKSALAVDIALEHNGEIISADSRQVYKGLDIGSAKITSSEMRGVPHHLLDVVKPEKIFSVQEFKKKAEIAIQEIIQRKNIPILCGGTGLYIDSVIYDMSFPEVEPNKKLREELNLKSTEELYKKLLRLDPARAQSIDKHNKYRLIRSLEIIARLGLVPRQKTRRKYTTLFIGLQLDPDELNFNIKQRILDRFKDDRIINEVRNLKAHGLSYERLESLGLEYRFIAQYLQKKISYNEMIKLLDQETKKFAKRQMTWFKRNKDILWFHPHRDREKINSIVENFVK